MKKITDSLFVYFKTVFSLFYFFLAVILISALSFFLGHPLLTGIMMGSDTSFALMVLTYLSEWFPKIPLWFPYQGAGQSITLGYYTFTYTFPILIERLSQFNLVQSMQLAEFLTVPIIALEIYLYCWLRLKNQTIGLIAALLYPLSSASWAWMTYGGFYAMSLSLVFLLPAFTLYDWYLDLHMRKDSLILKTRLALLGAVIFIGLALISHLSVGASLLLGMGVYTFFRSQLLPLEISRKKSVFVALGCLLLVVILGVLFSAFGFFPQRHYNSQVTREMVPVYGPDIPQLKLTAFLGIDRYDPKFDSIYQPMFLHIVVTIFTGVGIFFGLIRRRSIAGLGLTIIILAFITSITQWINSLSYFFSVLMLPTNVRLVSFVFIIAPILAAYGFWSLAETPFLIIKRILKTIHVKTEPILNPLIFVAATVASFIIFAYVLQHFRYYQRWPSGEFNQFAYSGFGPMGVIPSFCLFDKSYTPSQGLRCEDLVPQFKISGIGRDPMPEFGFPEFSKKNGFNQFTRTDVSMNLGLFTATANLHSDMSMINSSNGIGSLIYVWWGHEARVMFLKGEWDARNVSEMAKYFGIQYVFLHAGDDKPVFYRYPPDVWRDTGKLAGDVALVKEYKNATGLVTHFSKPTVLIIGDIKKRAYEQIFKLAYSGGLSYDQGLIVEGKKNIDDYDFSELSRFNTLILHGYSYKNKNKAYTLLKRYVEKGGSVFIDNGWQYIDRDWGEKKVEIGEDTLYQTDFLDPIPVKKTTWGSVGTSWESGKINAQFAPGINISLFAPPAWQDTTWGMAVAERKDLRSWAKPILSIGDKVIIAGGNFGDGKIIWSGMNIFAHSIDNNNKEEYTFLYELINFLLPDKKEMQGKIILERDFPDKIAFTFEEETQEPSWLYFREAYSTDWRPSLKFPNGKDARVTLYRAGPGLTLVYLPPLSVGSQLTLVYSLGLLLPLSLFLTITTFFLLLLFLIDGTFGKQRFEVYLLERIRRILPQFKRPTLKQIVGDEDE